MKWKFWKSTPLPLDMQCRVDNYKWQESKCHGRRVDGWELCSQHLSQYFNSIKWR